MPSFLHAELEKLRVTATLKDEETAANGTIKFLPLVNATETLGEIPLADGKTLYLAKLDTTDDELNIGVLVGGEHRHIIVELTVRTKVKSAGSEGKKTKFRVNRDISPIVYRLRIKKSQFGRIRTCIPLVDFKMNKQMYCIRAQLFDPDSEKPIGGPSNVLTGFRHYTRANLVELLNRAEHHHAATNRFINVTKYYKGIGEKRWMACCEKGELNLEQMPGLQGACPLRNEGLKLFRVNVRQFHGACPTLAPTHRMQIKCESVLNTDTKKYRVFFIDWACCNARHMHYMNIAVLDCERDDKLIEMCTRLCIELNTNVALALDGGLVEKGNEFFLIHKPTGDIFVRNDLWVNIWTAHQPPTAEWTVHSVNKMRLRSSAVVDGCTECKVVQ